MKYIKLRTILYILAYSSGILTAFIFGLFVSSAIYEPRIALIQAKVEEQNSKPDVQGISIQFPAILANSIGTTNTEVGYEFVQQPQIATNEPQLLIVGLNKDSMWQAIQNWRAQNGYGIYVENPTLCQFANQRLGHVQANWSHSGFTKLNESTYKLQQVSENLARGMDSPQQVLDAWSASPSHRANLERWFTSACVATDGNYVVLIMGTI